MGKGFLMFILYFILGLFFIHYAFGGRAPWVKQAFIKKYKWYDPYWEPEEHMHIFFKNIEDRDYDRLRDVDARRVFNLPLHAEEALAHAINYEYDVIKGQRKWCDDWNDGVWIDLFDENIQPNRDAIKSLLKYQLIEVEYLK